VRVNEVLGYFGGNTSQGRRKYERFVEEGLSKKVENPLERGKGHGVVGSMEFMERIKQRFLPASIQSRELRIIAVHGIRGKSQRISERDIKIALERKKDWWLREA